ncbi:pentapeptide repeat-containing protein [Rhodococcus sp. 06-156-3C]|uniref:pentapeptide repeat-containing protein n=1 Tax=Nocardiaceae TaxID=85025 RepID=UPI00068F31D0|nr:MULTISPECIES: pentapeptide repeat-containing protein [Rhodococcus]OZD13031.1 pentapeptide repeat-containing protein [Rhodococcus sp. 06-156-4a]OZD17900.1 pentapeptide repeat-containing protein [Rhodococcus sp. 06-156-3C]OZD20625.1 pentapeptide repeat-containing protein [Rhodococcus sp. 06-156-4C]OZD30657.1 pentapeptide repeat-containing protein [Rhodococcus sp. 06-156-3b]OZD32570.1 pentapeptide repeat-containing protein [Rhodococcus sp. 06-156-3]
MANSRSYPSKWKSFWFWTSLLAVILALGALVALIWVGSAKEWFAERFSGVYTPAGAVLVAALASLGAALNYYHQAKDRHDRETEEANHKREAALWERFHKAAEAFGTKERDLVGIRQAGVYALCGVGDDWVRYRRGLGDEEQALKNEVETIADLLCAQLRRKAHIPACGIVRGPSHENESQVNDAIISQLAVRLNEQHGTWKGLGLILDLHGADLTKSLWANLDLRQAVLVDADMRDIDLRKSSLAGADLTRAQIEKADITGSDLTSSQLAKADQGPHGFVDNTPPSN